MHQTLRLLHRYKTCCNTASVGGVTWWAMVVSIKVPHAQVEGSGEDLGSTRQSPPPGETRQAADRVSSRGTSRWCPHGRPRWPAGKEERKHESTVNMLVKMTCDTVPRFERCAEKNGASRRQTEARLRGGREQRGKGQYVDAEDQNHEDPQCSKHRVVPNISWDPEEDAPHATEHDRSHIQRQDRQEPDH